MSEACNNPQCDCHLSIQELAAKRGFCICFDTIIPRGRYARPSASCPRHKTLAVRWKNIKSMDDFNAALLADHRPEWGEFIPEECFSFDHVRETGK
jgi:hypothetical protein